MSYPRDRERMIEVGLASLGSYVARTWGLDDAFSCFSQL
jgi:hypothetical protein